MKRIFLTILVALLIAAAFAAGMWNARRASTQSAAPAQRKILYWVDPMHPKYTSDKPGIAPDCGMKLKPVYAGEAPPEASNTDTTGVVPGAFQITPEKQQMIGVEYSTAEIASGGETVR